MNEENKSVLDMWQNYLATINESVEDTKKTYEAWSFCFGGEVGDRLATLVLEGTKTATASLQYLYELDDEEDEIPAVGDLSIILDGSGVAKCVIETTDVQLVPFNKVSSDFAALEGEGDLSLDYWRRVHEAFFSEELKTYGKSFSEDMLVVCEQFEVVYTDTLIEINALAYLGAEDLRAVKALEEHCIVTDDISLKLELDYKESLAKENASNESGTGVNNEFLYKVNGELVGYLGICGFDGVNLEVNGMVHPNYRRQRIFTKLMKLAFDGFRQRKETTLLLLCDSDSDPGQAFVKSLDSKYDFSEFEMYLDFEAELKACDRENLLFRKATNADAEEIGQQNAIYFDKPLEEVDMPLPETEEARGMTIYLAILKDQVIGKVNIQLINGEAGIYGVGVRPEYRGKGYGRAILNFAVSKAKELNADRIMLQVEAENSTALSLYTSCGFRVVSKMDYYQAL